MLCYLIHVSTATFADVHENLLEIDRQARENNPIHGITGLLLYDSGHFFQILEGEEKEVDTLYDNVKRDVRNKNVILIAKEKLEVRNFPNWTMKIKDISHLTDINWSPPAEIIQTHDVNEAIPYYVTILSNLLLGTLKDEYKEIQLQQKDKSNETENIHIKLFRSLSDREKQVLKLIIEGYTAKKIGRLLTISDKTAARHVENMCKKLQASNKSDLITKVFSSGYLNEILSFNA